MPWIDKKEENTQAVLPSVLLKQLLVTLVQFPKIGFRCRQIGEMWMVRHMRVTSVGHGSFVLYDDSDTRYHIVRINNVMQFDLDERFQTFQPNFHYDVAPSNELEF